MRVPILRQQYSIINMVLLRIEKREILRESGGSGFLKYIFLINSSLYFRKISNF